MDSTQMKGDTMKLFRIKFKDKLKIKDSAPTILTVVAIGGVIFTAATAIHDTPKALKLIKHEEDDRKFRVKVYTDENVELPDPKPLTLWEKFKLTWKCFVPTFIVAATTCVCIAKIDILNKRQKKELIAAAGLLSTSYYEYRNKVRDLIGEKAEQEIVNDICEDHANHDKIEYGDSRPDAKTFIFVDSFNKTVFESTIEDVQAAEYHLNRNFALMGHQSMGDFYRFLGLDEVYAEDGPILERFGWSYDVGTDMGYEWIDFYHEKIVTEGEPDKYIIHYPFEPVLGYLYA